MTIGGSDAARELEALRPWAAQAPAIGVEERRARLDRARDLTERLGAQALLVAAGPSLRYFTGLSWSLSERLVALLLPVSGAPVMIAPAFERGSIEAELALPCAMALWEEHEDPFGMVAQLLARGATLAVDPLLPFVMAERLRGAGCPLVDATPVIDGCRARKSPAEIALLQQAKDMTLEVQRRAARILAPGITTGAVKRFIDEAHRALGAAGSSFCIVQFGHATAYPHGLPGEQALADGDVVLIDTGCLVQGYHSDITRTYAFGDPGDEVRAIWAVEREAQAAAFDAAQPGAPCEAVDAAARAVLERAGLGPDYRLPGLPHRTGHGIGLAIHEAPYLVRGDRTPLDTGMCFSNEPMIVVPDRFGIRLEDHFHITDTGPRWFTEPSPAIDRPFG